MFERFNRYGRRLRRATIMALFPFIMVQGGTGSGGGATLNGASERAIARSDARGKWIKYYFNAASGTSAYAGSRAVDVIREPFTMIFFKDNDQDKIDPEKLNDYPPLYHAAGEFPPQSGERLPDLEALYVRLCKNQFALEDLQEKSAYIEIVVKYDHDKRGALKEMEIERREMTRHNGRRVWRTIARNGQPLSPRDQAEEDRRVEKSIRKLDSGDFVTPPDYQWRTKLSDHLRVSRFTNPRRERFRSRNVIVIDLEPNPNYKPTNIYDRLLHSMKGSIWVDELDVQIARAELEVTEALKVGGGALGVMKQGSRFIAEQARFNGGAWLPSFHEVSIGGKALLVGNIAIDQKITYSDYRRIGANSEEKFESRGGDKGPGKR